MSNTETTSESLNPLTAQEVKQQVRRTTNVIFDSSEINKPLPQLIKESALAEMFGITQKTVSMWRAAGKLPFIKISGQIFYSLDDVHNFIKKHRKVAKATV